MAKKKNYKQPPPRKQSRLGEFITWIIIIIVVAVIGYFIYDRRLSDAPKVEKETEAKSTKPISGQIRLLNGTWDNNSGRSTITFTNNQYSMDFPSVEGGQSLTGAFQVSNDTIFLYTDSQSNLCAGTNATYVFSHDKKKLNTKLVNDNCLKRSTQMQEGWHK
ncbi:MAG: hypothetical protein ACEPOV_11015 [Hyphomicrobiales bacterium]